MGLLRCFTIFFSHVFLPKSMVVSVSGQDVRAASLNHTLYWVKSLTVNRNKWICKLVKTKLTAIFKFKCFIHLLEYATILPFILCIHVINTWN